MSRPLTPIFPKKIRYGKPVPFATYRSPATANPTDGRDTAAGTAASAALPPATPEAVFAAHAISRNVYTGTLASAPNENDLIICWIKNTNAFVTMTTPASWVNPLGGNTQVTSDSNCLSAIYHFVTAAEAAASTTGWVFTNYWSGADTGGCHTVVVTGANPGAPIDATATSFNSGSVTPHILKGLTPTVTNGTLLSGIAKDTGGGGVYPAPAGWSAVIAVDNQGSSGVYSYGSATVASSPIADTNITPFSADEYCNISLVVAAS